MAQTSSRDFIDLWGNDLWKSEYGGSGSLLTWQDRMFSRTDNDELHLKMRHTCRAI